MTLVIPSTPTAPIIYTWSDTLSCGQGTYKATYTWTTEGSKTVSVTASNYSGTSEIISYKTIDISASAGGPTLYLPLIYNHYTPPEELTYDDGDAESWQSHIRAILRP